MLSQNNLIRVLQDELEVYREAGRNLTDVHSLERVKAEVAAVLRHLQMTDEAGEDQVELEQVVKSLEENPLLGSHQKWREKAMN